MESNPQKCNVIRVTRKKRPIEYKYLLYGHTLEAVQSGKYLEATLHNQLNWTEHICNIRAKSCKTLGILRRNLQGCRPDIKATANSGQAHIGVCSHCMGAISADPHTITILESVQRRAASLFRRISTLQWESLETRRLKSRLVRMFKIKHDLIDVPATSYLTSGNARTRGSSYRQSTASRDVYKYSFFSRTTRDWNSLP